MVCAATAASLMPKSKWFLSPRGNTVVAWNATLFTSSSNMKVGTKTIEDWGFIAVIKNARGNSAPCKESVFYFQ